MQKLEISEEQMTVDVLAIGAHPDDVELSCAGTLLMAKRAGKRIGIVDLTHAELSTRGTVESRKIETDAASKVLGLDVRANLGLPDGDVQPTREHVLKVVSVIREYRPTVLLCPHKHERHPDHEATSEIVHRALFLSGLVKLETRGLDGAVQAPHRPLLAMQYMQTYTFHPTIILDVSPVFSARMQAMEAYSSQFARPRNGEMPDVKGQERETFLTQSSFFDWIRARASSYGMLIGVEHGEPFWTHEPLGTADLFSLVTKRVA